MICKYFFPFSRLPFHCVDCFLCCAQAFQFDVALLVDFCFCCLHFWCQKPKLIAKPDVKELTAYIFLQLFFGFRSSIHFELIFVYDVRQWSIFIFLNVAVQSSHPHLLKRQTVLPPLCILGSFYKLIDDMLGFFSGLSTLFH